MHAAAFHYLIVTFFRFVFEKVDIRPPLLQTDEAMRLHISLNFSTYKLGMVVFNEETNKDVVSIQQHVPYL